MSHFGLLKEANLTPPISPASPITSTLQMVEKNSQQMTIRSASHIKIPNQAYLTTAMLLGTQNNYLGQRLNKDSEKEMPRKEEIKIRDCNSGSMPTSTFTIDSILASSKPVDIKFEYNSKSDSRSPSNSPSLSTASSPVRPTRVPAMLHPGLHLSHLAAAAATGFGTPSDFLGECDSLLK